LLSFLEAIIHEQTGRNEKFQSVLALELDLRIPIFNQLKHSEVQVTLLHHILIHSGDIVHLLHEVAHLLHSNKYIRNIGVDLFLLQNLNNFLFAGLITVFITNLIQFIEVVLLLLIKQLLNYVACSKLIRYEFKFCWHFERIHELRD
jgi:hypothetical protein